MLQEKNDRVRVEPVGNGTRKAFYCLAQEYLPDSDYEKVKTREEVFPGAYQVVLLEDEVVGVAFGWSRRLDVDTDDSLELNGIAVTERHQRKGYGRLLLKAMEDAARAYGCPFISVGSAGGYVEHFYLENGFLPRTYKVYTDDGIRVEKEFRDLEDYKKYQRRNPEGFVVFEKKL